MYSSENIAFHPADCKNQIDEPPNAKFTGRIAALAKATNSGMMPIMDTVTTLMATYNLKTEDPGMLTDCFSPSSKTERRREGSWRSRPAGWFPPQRMPESHWTNSARQFDPENLKRAEEQLDAIGRRAGESRRRYVNGGFAAFRFFLHSFPRRVIFRRRDLKPGGKSMKLWCFALLAALTVCVSANDLTTKSGVVYKDYSINGPSVDGLVIFHELGGATVPYAELPDDLRTKYKADEEKAAATLKEREEQRKEVKKRQAEEAARIQEEQLKREKEFQELRGLFGYYLGEEISESDILKKEKNISLKAKRKDWGATDCVVKLTKSGKIYFINKLFTEISDPLPLAEKIKTNIPAIRVQSSDNKTSIKATARVDNRYLEADVS